MSNDPANPDITRTPGQARLPEQFCPACRRPLPAGAPQCPHCGVSFAAGGEPLPDLRQKRTEAIDFIVPIHDSIWALLCFYLGILSLGIPLAAFCLETPLLVLASFLAAGAGLVCGVIALWQWKKESTYSAVTSNLRAILGVAFCVLGLLISSIAVFFVLLAISKK